MTDWMHKLPIWQVISEGIPWKDSDGKTKWTYMDAEDIADSLERKGYAEVVIVDDMS